MIGTTLMPLSFYSCSSLNFRNLVTTYLGKTWSCFSPQKREELDEESVPPIEATAQLVSEAVTAHNKIGQPPVIDVPGKGNCLFCAMAIGLRKKMIDQSAIQEKLNWAVDPHLLVGDLHDQDSLLQAPSERLRQQAADYCTEHFEDECMQAALMGAVIDHNAVFEESLVREKQRSISLQGEINKIANQVLVLADSQNSQESEKLRNEEMLAITNDLISHFQGQLIEDYSLRKYIERSREDRFYCGSAQVYALSRLYEVPINIIFNYGCSTARTEVFNPSQSSLSSITLAHVNGNHFKYVDD